MEKENVDLKIKVKPTSAFTWDFNATPGPGITNAHHSGVYIPDVLGGLAVWWHNQPKLKPNPDH